MSEIARSAGGGASFPIDSEADAAAEHFSAHAQPAPAAKGGGPSVIIANLFTLADELDGVLAACHWRREEIEKRQQHIFAGIEALRTSTARIRELGAERDEALNAEQMWATSHAQAESSLAALRDRVKDAIAQTENDDYTHQQRLFRVRRALLSDPAPATGTPASSATTATPKDSE